MANISKRSLAGGKLVYRFKDETGKLWRVYEASRRTHPRLFDGPGAVGCTWYKERKIFLDAEQGDFEKWISLLHELMHTSLREMGMHEALEEEFVETTSCKLARYLGQCLDGEVY